MKAVLADGAVKAPAVVIAEVTSLPSAGVEPSGKVPLATAATFINSLKASRTDARRFRRGFD